MQADTTDNGPHGSEHTHFYLWSTTVTVGAERDFLGYDANVTNPLGSISTGAKFNYPPWSPPHKHHVDPDYEYTITGLYIDEFGGFNLALSDTSTLTQRRGNVTLWIRNTKFRLRDGSAASGEISFNSATGHKIDVPDLDWSEDEEVRVALVYERQLPSAPENVQVTAPDGEVGTLEVSWDAADAGTFPIECYLVEFRHPSGEAKKRKQSYPGSRGTGKGCGDTPPTRVKRTDLEKGVQYQVLVQALSGDGFSEWSDMKTARTNRVRALQGRFVSPPERHDGTNRIKVRVEFSEAPENVGADGVEVEGGAVTSVLCSLRAYRARG